MSVEDFNASFERDTGLSAGILAVRELAAAEFTCCRCRHSETCIVPGTGAVEEQRRAPTHIPAQAAKKRLCLRFMT